MLGIARPLSTNSIKLTLVCLLIVDLFGHKNKFPFHYLIIFSKVVFSAILLKSMGKSKLLRRFKSNENYAEHALLYYRERSCKQWNLPSRTYPDASVILPYLHPFLRDFSIEWSDRVSLTNPLFIFSLLSCVSINRSQIISLGDSSTTVAHVLYAHYKPL